MTLAERLEAEARRRSDTTVYRDKTITVDIPPEEREKMRREIKLSDAQNKLMRGETAWI